MQNRFSILFWASAAMAATAAEWCPDLNKLLLWLRPAARLVFCFGDAAELQEGLWKESTPV